MIQIENMFKLPIESDRERGGGEIKMKTLHSIPINRTIQDRPEHERRAAKAITQQKKPTLMSIKYMGTLEYIENSHMKLLNPHVDIPKNQFTRSVHHTNFTIV